MKRKFTVKIRRILTASLVATAFFASTSVLAATANTPSSPSMTTTHTSFNPQQVKDIQKIVHDYLVTNPNVLVEASQSLQKQAEEKQEQYAMQAIEKNKQQLFNDSTSPVAGNKNGDVTLVEFFDYQCGHCKAMNPIIQKIVKDNKNLRVVFKELPIFGESSQFAAKASLASAKQSKYYKFHDALLNAENPLNKARILKVAKKVGLNIKELEKDMKSPAIAKQLREDFKLAQSLRLIGTPTFVIGNTSLTSFKFIPGATSQENLQNLITEVSKTNNATAPTAKN